MNVNELYDLVESFYGYKIHMRSLDTKTKEVVGILYDSFVLKCDINDRYGRFGAGIDIGENGFITNFLGEHCSLNSDEKSIKESLKLIDEYCRLRLPDKFLDAYYKAYVLDLYTSEE
ncbi:hypothetical protein SAMN02910289_01153 [Lachnospiraceae bacterium RM5]|nr:hypothetical protein SAMN02910289_01153 [Lachnospiraceae bacterium RM5]